MDINEIKNQVLATTSQEVIKKLISNIDLSKLDFKTLAHIQNVLGDFGNIGDLMKNFNANDLGNIVNSVIGDQKKEEPKNDAASLLNSAMGLLGKKK